MNRAGRRRAERAGREGPLRSMGRTPSGGVVMLPDVRLLPDGGVELPTIHTYPGCDRHEHRLEVAGAMSAMADGHRWKGRTLMDCGCWLSID